ncbi:MAG: serine/threonine-protein phosphatase [Verrucomicrobiota bacterium]|nr:serine/threonine-protein phosphatase [Verrucomicrobiota bacterium]
MPQIEKKIYSGSLARRVWVVCIAFLVLPLLIHSFFLYHREIRVAEEEVRAILQTIGTELAQTIEDLIAIDEKILTFKTAALANAFQFELVQPPAQSDKNFTLIDRSRDLLLVGQKMSGGAQAIPHSLKELLTIEHAPFPIQATFEKPSSSQWAENFLIPNSSLKLFLVVDKKEIESLQTRHLLFRVGTFLLLIGLFGGGIVFVLLQKLSKPLESLCLTMSRVSEGAVRSRFVPQPYGFEINAIGMQFNETLDALLHHQEEAEKERLSREKLAHELKLGHDLQADLLPKSFPSFQYIEMASGYLPAKEVSGDFYDVLLLPSGKMLIAIADVAGKGIPACLFSLGLRSALRALAIETPDLGEIVRKANDVFLLDVKETGWFATLWLGLYDGKTLHYLSFGHPPALLKRGQELKLLTTEHPALGVLPFDSLKAFSCLLEKGDQLLLYTDGVTEAINPEHLLYTVVRLQDSFLRANNARPADSIHHLLSEVQFFMQTIPQQDDLTLLLLQF